MTDDHVDVLIIGAGLSGIGAAYHLQEEFPGRTYTILESRDAIGGTINEEGDGVQAALVNFRFLAHALWTTQEAAALMHDASRTGTPVKESCSAA